MRRKTVSSSEKIPATVVNGFLGSGKTTIISNLIDFLTSKNQKVIYVKNEIGDQDLDAKIMRGKNIISKELLNGCICCTLVGPFISAIDEIAQTYSPDRIIIESAGSADPASIALMVENHPQLDRDGVLVVIDVVNFNNFEKIDHVSQRQTEFTDLIIFNKVEQVDLARKKQVVGYVRELNEHAPIVETTQGRINPELVFGLAKSDLNELINQQEHTNGHNAHHEQDDQIDAFTYKNSKIFDEKVLLNYLQTLPKNILRIKGVIQTQAGFKVLNCVFKRCNLTGIPDNTNFENSEIIFIGYQVANTQQEIETQLNSL